MSNFMGTFKPGQCRYVADNGVQCGGHPELAFACRSHAAKILQALMLDPEARERVLDRRVWEMWRDEQDTLHEEHMAKIDARLDARKNPVVHVVYYVRLGQDRIKIGTTQDLVSRMRSLRVFDPEQVLAVEPGGVDVEQRRLSGFGHLRYDKRREDVHESPMLLEHIADTRKKYGEPFSFVGVDKIGSER